MANYLYNGVEFPDINEVWTDKDTYPYAYISGEWLHTGKSIGHTNMMGNWCASLSLANGYQNIQGDGWVLHNSEGSVITPVTSISWANFDILNEDGSVYLAASEPVLPGYAIISRADYKSACDAIRAKNGKTDLIKSGDMAGEIKKPSQFRKKLIDRSLAGDLKKEDLEGVTCIEYYAFANCKIESADIPDTVVTIGSRAFSECFSLRKVILPNSLSSILGNAFMNCSGLTEIILPDNISTIGNYAFAGCTSLQSIALPSGINTINENVFTACAALSNITIPNTVTNIGKNAFRNCTSLTTIDLPKNITEIASSAFSGCTNLKTIYADWEEGKVSGAPWGATNATVVYTRYQESVIIDKRDAAARLIGESLDAVTLNDGYYFPYGQAYAKLAAVGNIVKATSGETIGFDGWIGFGKEIVAFGVGVAEPGSDLAVDNMFWGGFKKPTEDGVLVAGGQYASRYLIQVPTEGVEEPMTVDVTWLALLEGNMIVKIHTVTLQVSVPETE